MLEAGEREKLESRINEVFSDYTEIAGGKNYRFFHLKTVRDISLKLAEKIDADIDTRILEVAALFHDIGRAEDIEDGEMNPIESHEGHPERGAEKVPEYISDILDGEEVAKVKKVISNHHSEPKTEECRVLQDADRLSKFGVNNLWRQFHYACQHELELEESIEYFWNTAREDYRNHIEEMHFEKSREVAEKRLEKHKESFNRIQKEMNAEDI